MKKLFEADWILPLAMDTLGYERIIHEHSPAPEYYRYANKAGTVSPHYGPMWKHKREIYFNCGYIDNLLTVGIKEDGGTRTVYNGTISSQEELIFLLNNVL